MEQGGLPLRRLLDEAFVHLRRHFTKIYFPVAIPVALVSGLVPIVQAVWFKGAGFPQPNPANLRLGAFAAGFGAFMGVFLLLLVVVTLGNIAFIVAAVDAVRLGSVDMGRAWRRSLNPRVFGTGLLASLAVFVGVMCCFLPGLYATLVLALVVQVVVAEDRFGYAALERSYDLTTYNPRKSFESDPRFKVFVISLAGFLMAYVIGMVVTLPAVVIQQVLMVRMVAAGARPNPGQLMSAMTWIQVPTQILSSLGREAVALYVSFTMSLLFFDLREQREGADLERAIIGLLEERGSPSS